MSHDDLVEALSGFIEVRDNGAVIYYDRDGKLTAATALRLYILTAKCIGISTVRYIAPMVPLL